MKQNQIARGLKGIVILLAVMGILFFGGITVYALPKHMTGIFFSWYIAALCYGVLFQFWKVCTQIGADNSFSMENAVSFQKMGYLSLAAGVGALVRLIFLSVTGNWNLWWIGYSVFFVLMTIVFWGLCTALARLVQNAYEVKLENELTI